MASTVALQFVAAAAADGASVAGNESLPAALAIVEQPPKTWYKDQFGRKATFNLEVRRALPPCARCAEQRHLSVTLVYENGKVVDNQSVLRVAAGLCLDKSDRSCLAVRIMEVSKNHQNQRFRLQIALAPCPDACSARNVVVTDPVLVLSKKNKRPVKTDDEDSPSKTKKTKCEGDVLSSPSPAPPAPPAITPTPLLSKTALLKPGYVQLESPTADPPGSSHTGISQRITDMFVDDPMGAAEPCWDTQLVPFTTPSDRVCLWANAAFNFLNKLQFQPFESTTGAATADATADVSDIFAHHLHKKYQCVVCREVYGASAAPAHREDCDLGLLLQQGRQSAKRGDRNVNANAKPVVEAPADMRSSYDDEYPVTNNTFNAPGFFSPGKTAVGLPRLSPTLPSPTIVHDAFKFSDIQIDGGPAGTGVNMSKPPVGPTAGSNGLDALAKSLDLNSWEGYSSLSRIMFSATMDNSRFMDWDGTSRLPGKSPTSATTTTLPALTNVTAATPPKPTGQLSISSFISSMKMMPADSAALLQEDEAALNGDASLLCSLSRVSLSELHEFMQQADEKKAQPPSSEPARATATATADPPVAASLSMLLTADPSDREGAVHSIVAKDFLHCGLPALDKERQLVGFYMLLPGSASSSAELHFLPNLYPLVPQMLEELEQDIAALAHDAAMLLSRSADSPMALDDLKAAVLAQLARRARAG